MNKALNAQSAGVPIADIQWISGKRWELGNINERVQTAIMQQYGLSPVLAALLTQRGVALENVASYLQPTLRELMSDPCALLDMNKAVARLVLAVQAGETIGIFGDYDVDGATSSALLVQYFRALNIPTRVHIPDRQKEGYGPNIMGLRRLKAQGAKVIITVDTGTLAHEVLAQAAQEGLEMIVVDHHQGEPALPEALAVVNPNRFDECSDYGHLAAAGVTFLLLVALNAALREEKNSPQPIDLRWLLDLVALGTVADVVPLTGLNRAFVRQGLTIMAQRRNVGLAALMDVGGLEEAPTSYHLGFVLGPRINAGGRVGQADLGVQLLSATSADEAQPIAQKLDVLNQERRAIEAHVVEQALQQAQHQQGALLIAQHEGWHEGVIGIAAGRLKEQYNQPAAVISWNDAGLGKASARSVKGVDLGQAVIAAKQAGLLEAGGGHAMAAGFSLQREKFEDFANFMQNRLEADVTHYKEESRHRVDAALPIAAATVELAQSLEQAGPFGAGNPNPRFWLQGATLVAVDILKEKHLRCIMSEGRDLAAGNARLKVMMFNAVESDSGQLLLNSIGRRFHLIVRLKRDIWRGRESVGVTVEDLAIIR